MASSVVSKGAPMAALLKKLLAAPSTASVESVAFASGRACVAGARRLYNTVRAPLHRYYNGGDDLEDSSDDDAFDDSRRARDSTFFSADLVDVDPFRAPTSLAGLLALVDDAAGSTAGLSAAARRGRGWWVATDDDEAVQLKVPMPGLGKEHVKVWAEQNFVVVKGEADAKEAEADGDEEGPPRYSCRVELAAGAFKMDEVTAEMKNGVLKVRVPRVKDEERKDVFHVQVE
ncbi:hypothetical protein ACP70R_018092 [Stipagrostis hirtigluma subsp. patula]